MKIWGIHKKYPALSWMENFMGGFISIGPVTIWGENAMNWTANIRIRGKYLCFTLPTIRRIFKKEMWYIYYSKDGTPIEADWGYSSKNMSFGEN